MVSSRSRTRKGLSQSFFDAGTRRGPGANQAFLKATRTATDLIGKQLAHQLELIEEWGRPGTGATLSSGEKTDTATVEVRARTTSEPVALDRSACLEFAVGSIGAVFGPDFVAADRFPTRVRLPDEPLMLVDRVLAIEGRRRSLEGGRIVTEHDVHPDAWYLDGGRIAPASRSRPARLICFCAVFWASTLTLLVWRFTGCLMRPSPFIEGFPCRVT